MAPFESKKDKLSKGTAGTEHEDDADVVDGTEDAEDADVVLRKSGRAIEMSMMSPRSMFELAPAAEDALALAPVPVPLSFLPSSLIAVVGTGLSAVASGTVT